MIGHVVGRRPVDIPLGQFMSRRAPGPPISVLTGRACAEIAEVEAPKNDGPAPGTISRALRRYHRQTLTGYVPLEREWILRSTIAEYLGILLVLVGTAMAMFASGGFLAMVGVGAATWFWSMLVIPLPTLRIQADGSTVVNLRVHPAYAAALGHS